jgi:hypothetical protein
LGAGGGIVALERRGSRAIGATRRDAAMEGDRMLTRLDDYPTHQTPEPLAHPVTGDRNFYDRYFFNGYTRDGDLFFAVAMGRYPNRRVQDAAVSVVQGGTQHVLRASRLAPLDPTETSVGPIAVDIEEPMRRIRLRIAPNEHGIEGDLVFLARTVPLEEPRFTRHAGTRLTMDLTRFAQFGGWQGHLTVDGERIDLEPSRVLGSRDRSWGVRGVGEREGGAPAPGPGQFYWLWAPIHFDDRCTHFGLNEDADGHAWHMNGVVAPAVAPGGLDAAEAALEPERMDRVEDRVTWAPGTRRLQSARLTLASRADEAHEIDLEPVEQAGRPLHFQMLGIGYGHPEWGHGMWRGELETAGDRYDLGSIDPLDPRHIHIQTLVRARMGEREGIGVLEQLVIGRHAPSGFESGLDGARA